MTTLPYKELLSGDKPLKSLLSSKKRQGGRNNFGRITMRHQGGGHKRRMRDVDFSYEKKNIPATIETIEYDPYRSAFIARTVYADGERRYVVAPKGMKVGDTFTVSEEAPITSGNRTILGRIPVGTFIYNIELQPAAGARMVRSAGNYAEVIAHDAGFALVKMPSTEVRKISDLCWASIGMVGNEEYNLVVIGKAGRSRWMGIRPTVRGTAMNPVDHPHGGQARSRLEACKDYVGQAVRQGSEDTYSEKVLKRLHCVPSPRWQEAPGRGVISRLIDFVC
jgi:large subunit ribosomal protein L2